MNIDGLIRKYFGESGAPVSIELFDNDSIFSVYKDIVNLLKAKPDIELSVLQALSYCFYEVLDNVLTHSEKICGTVILRYLPDDNRIQVLVADDGIGIQKSLMCNPAYNGISEKDAVLSCIKDRVTDGKGMGFGLYSTARLVENAGVVLEIISGSSKMTYDGIKTIADTCDYWQGTIVYFELRSDKEIVPNDVVDNRTDCEGEFNDMFLNTDSLDNLW